MTGRLQSESPGWNGFRIRLLIAMMLVVTAITALTLSFAQRNVAATAQRELGREFQGELAAFHALREIRHALLAERCRTLARRSRIHAALEDDALDLLYPSARDEMHEVMDGSDPAGRDPAATAFHARFYRFLDGQGRVIAPAGTRDGGRLLPEEEAQLNLPAVPERAQTGYLWRSDGDLDDVIAMPIISTETGRPIAALVLGFRPADLSGRPPVAGMISGLWSAGRLHLPALAGSARADLARRLAGDLGQTAGKEHGIPLDLAGAPCLLFSTRINPGSAYAPAYEVCIYPLADSIARQRRLFWQFSGVGAVLLLGAFGASHFLSLRLARPVEKLAVESAENRARRRQAETALELTHEELQRSARFSADASHQLKTPVTVLRAGLEDLLAEENLAADVREEVAALVHQTFRLTSVIEDLLLLSRMDAGRLQLRLGPVDLTRLIEGWLDDLGTLPGGLELTVETDLPPALPVAGEERYTTLILQNLLENARKYNRPGGRIRVAARLADGWVILALGNTGPAIPAAARENIFQRFHRGAMGENRPGHGLGLNLALELMRLHHGELRLVRSADDWTEFEARFRAAPPPGPPS